MGEIDSTSHLTYRVLFIIVTLLFGSAFSLVGEIWNTSQSAIAAEIPSSNAYQPEVNKPCKLLSHTTPRGKFSDSIREAKPMFREPQPAVIAPPVAASIPRTKPDARLRVVGKQEEFRRIDAGRQGAAVELHAETRDGIRILR